MESLNLSKSMAITVRRFTIGFEKQIASRLEFGYCFVNGRHPLQRTGILLIHFEGAPEIFFSLGKVAAAIRNHSRSSLRLGSFGSFAEGLIRG